MSSVFEVVGVLVLVAVGEGAAVVDMVELTSSNYWCSRIGVG